MQGLGVPDLENRQEEKDQEEGLQIMKTIEEKGLPQEKTTEEKSLLKEKEENILLPVTGEVLLMRNTDVDSNTTNMKQSTQTQ